MKDGSNKHEWLTAPRRMAAIAVACLVSLPAHAFLLQGEALDKVASVMALVVLFVVPIVGITVFWLLHVMPEKIAHKRHHPQRDAIHMLCILSLFFGGLLWPLAFLWAYSKPVMHKLAYGRDKHDDYYAEEEVAARAENEHVKTDVAKLRGNVERLVAKGSTPDELAAIRDQLAALEARIAAQGVPAATPAAETH